MFQDQLDSYVDVRTYGAVLDGVTDDTDAFIAAGNAANNGCGYLFIPPVTTNNAIDGGLLISPVSVSWRRLTVFGINHGGYNSGVYSRTSRIKLKNASSGSLITLIGDGGTSVQNVRFQGLMLDGNKANQGAVTSHGIYLPTSTVGEDSFVEIDHCYIKDFVSDCVNSEFGRRATKIVDCKLWNSKNGWNCASSDGWLDKCDIGQMSEDGVQIKDWTVAITGNNIFSCRNGINLLFGQAALTNVIGNKIDRHQLSGIRAYGKNATIMGNVFHRNSESGTNAASHIQIGGEYVTVMGNTFKDGGGLGYLAAYDVSLDANITATVMGNATGGRGFSSTQGHIGRASNSRCVVSVGEYDQTPRAYVQATLDTATTTANTIAASTFRNEIIRRTGTPAGPVTDTTDTAANLVIDMGVPFSILNNSIGSAIRFKYINQTGQTITLAGGTGVAVVGTATVANNAWREFTLNINSATTCTLTNVGGGAL